MKCQLLSFKQVDEPDGSLVFFESNQEIPFDIRRVFYMFSVPENQERANHACENSDYVLVAIQGSVEVITDDGRDIQKFVLTSRKQGLFIPRMTWMKTFNFSTDAVLMVISNVRYQDSKYIEIYDDFLTKVVN